MRGCGLCVCSGVLDWSSVQRLESVLQAYSLPTALPKHLSGRATPRTHSMHRALISTVVLLCGAAKDIIEKMEIDKKNTQNQKKVWAVCPLPCVAVALCLSYAVGGCALPVCQLVLLSGLGCVVSEPWTTAIADSELYVVLSPRIALLPAPVPLSPTPSSLLLVLSLIFY
jgi:hypothetical protein